MLATLQKAYKTALSAFRKYNIIAVMLYLAFKAFIYAPTMPHIAFFTHNPYNYTFWH